MDTKKFWLAIAALVAVTIITCSGFSDLRDRARYEAVARLIERGTDPFVARCAVLGSMDDGSRYCAPLGR